MIRQLSSRGSRLTWNRCCVTGIKGSRALTSVSVLVRVITCYLWCGCALFGSGGCACSGGPTSIANASSVHNRAHTIVSRVTVMFSWSRKFIQI